MHLEFDDLLRPTGKWHFKYGQHIGLCVHKLNINWDWQNVSEGLRQTLWADTMALFHIPDDTKFKRLFLSSLADRFRDFKSKLVTGWITGTRKRFQKEENRMTYQVYKHIKGGGLGDVCEDQVHPRSTGKT